MWTRAVWEEGNKIHEGVIPKVWIENNTVRWPSGLNVRKPHAEKQTPCANWKTFRLLKSNVLQVSHFIEDKIRITA